MKQTNYGSRWLASIVSLVFVCLGLSQGAIPVSAQGFRPVRGHVVSSLERFYIRHYHPQGELDLLSSLRAQVHRAVREGNPAAAVSPLKRITTLEPHDYYAWEFLSYTYAVLGDAGSAANVDLDTVAYFQFVPEAAPQVSRATARLQGFDPGGWQSRVQNIRESRLPHIPICAIDHFVDIVKPDISSENRSISYSKVETVLERREVRIAFINRWTEQVSEKDKAKVEIETQETWKKTAEVIRALH
jgi:hypothetical protein